MSSKYTLGLQPTKVVSRRTVLHFSLGQTTCVCNVDVREIPCQISVARKYYNVQCGDGQVIRSGDCEVIGRSFITKEIN